MNDLAMLLPKTKINHYLIKSKLTNEWNDLNPKKNVMKKLGASTHHSKSFPIMHVILTAMHNLLHNDVPLHWKEENEKVFITVKQTLKHTCELTLPNTINLFFIIVDNFAIGFGTVLFQADNKDQMQYIS